MWEFKSWVLFQKTGSNIEASFNKWASLRRSTFPLQFTQFLSWCIGVDTLALWGTCQVERMKCFTFFAWGTLAFWLHLGSVYDVWNHKYLIIKCKTIQYFIKNI